MSGTEKLANLLGKLVDNTHLGKIFTDFTPGLILTGASLLVVAEFTTFEVVPFPYAARYQQEFVEAEKELTDARARVVVLEGKVAALAARKTAAEARVESAEALAAQGASNEDGAPPSAKGPSAAESKPDPQAAAADAAAAESALAEVAAELARETQNQADAKARIKPLEDDVSKRRDRRDSARTLSGNIGALTDNMAEVVGFALVLGALLAQISGKLFWNGAFWSYLTRRVESRDDKGQVRTEDNSVWAQIKKYVNRKDLRNEIYWRGRSKDEVVKQVPELDKDYFRYIEIAMNAILPVALLAAALGVSAVHALYLDRITRGWVFAACAVAAVVAARQLYLNARVLYVGYFVKKAEVVRVLSDTAGTPLEDEPEGR